MPELTFLAKFMEQLVSLVTLLRQICGWVRTAEQESHVKTVVVE